jgi:hypothetical protein
LRVLEQEGCVYFIYVRKSLTPLHAELKDALMARSWSRSTWMAYWDAGCNSTRADGGWMECCFHGSKKKRPPRDRHHHARPSGHLSASLAAVSAPCLTAATLSEHSGRDVLRFQPQRFPLTQGKITAIATPHGKSQVPTARMDHLKTATTCQTAVTYRLTDTGRCTGRMWKVATADSPNSMLVTHTLHLR